MEHRMGIVRNPWDRMVSAWAYVRKRLPDQFGEVSFPDFVMGKPLWTIGRKPTLIPFQQTSQMAWLWPCNDILMFEALDDDLPLWARKVLGRKMAAGVSNTSDRTWVGYRDYYLTRSVPENQELIDWVADVFKPEIDLFEYHF